MIDFGVARAFGRVAHTSPGGLKGKIDYMSPEQASAEEVDHRADVFALGVVLWEALTGRRLFRRETELATMRAIVDDPIPHPSEMATIPPELDTIVMRALRKRKDARFASAQEMAVALEKFAFSNQGFSPMQVAAYTKSLFATEYLQWRKTATAALDLEVEKPEKNGQDMGIGAEPPTAGPTMALRPGVAWQEGRSEMRSSSGRSRSSPSQAHARSRSRSAYSQPRALDGQPGTGAGTAPRRDRTWLYAVVGALLAIGGGGAWMLTRHQDVSGEVSQPALPSAPMAPPVIDNLSSSPEAPRPGPAVEPAVARTPAPAPTPVGTAPVAPAPTPVTAQTPPAGSAPDTATWKALSRPAKTKATGAHRKARPRAAESAGDDKEKPAQTAESHKADPFAD
jgi:serine/threonine-protein kinase